jgi:hypothetical protein
MNMHAIQVKKNWYKWCIRELGEGYLPEDELNKSILSWLRNKKPQLGSAVSFETNFENENEVVQFLCKAIERLSPEVFVAMVGEVEEPVIFFIQKIKLPNLIVHAVKANKPWNLASMSDGANLLICPEVASTEKELLVAASGSFENIIEKLKEIRPDGNIFRGN